MIVSQKANANRQQAKFRPESQVKLVPECRSRRLLNLIFSYSKVSRIDDSFEPIYFDNFDLFRISSLCEIHFTEPESRAKLYICRERSTNQLFYAKQTQCQGRPNYLKLFYDK